MRGPSAPGAPRPRDQFDNMTVPRMRSFARQTYQQLTAMHRNAHLMRMGWQCRLDRMERQRNVWAALFISTFAFAVIWIGLEHGYRLLP